MGVGFTLCIKTIKNLGSEKHAKFAKHIFKFKEVGCFGLTELGHGSNVKGIETTATYDKLTWEFVINTPNEKSMKFWIGGAAKAATVCVIWAQLIIDDHWYGVHAFVGWIRNKNHDLMPGVIIGDCGLKQGVHGIDNGFLVFENFWLPYDSLLDKFCSITSDGIYQSPLKSSTWFALSLASLSTGRLTITSGSSRCGVLACQIALWFAC